MAAKLQKNKFIANNDFGDAILTLRQILENETIAYSDKNKAEELLALANFSKDN